VDLHLLLKVRTCTGEHRRGQVITSSIERDRDRLLVGEAQKARSCVTMVVIDQPDATRVSPSPSEAQNLKDVSQVCVGLLRPMKSRSRKPRDYVVGESAPIVESGPGVECDDVGFVDLQTSLLQAPSDRKIRKRPRVFVAVQPFFFQERNRLSIDHEGGGGI
jgi:hypothetical protein